MRVVAALVSSFLSLAVVSATSVTELEYQTLFTGFVAKFEKTYSTDQFFSRYEIFKTNVDEINEHNSKLGLSFTKGINEFSDLTWTEFSSARLGLNPRKSSNSPFVADLTVEAPSDLDWVARGAVTAVKNQGQCGSCWAFSTTGSTEGANFIKTGTLTSFSEQQLVDCAGAQGNNGCNGGLMDDGFEFIEQNNGICSEDSYPYTAQDGKCQTTCANVGTVSSYKDVTEGDETSLMNALLLGPVSIAIEADKTSFQSYSGGVYSSKMCGKNLDHGVLLVGFGTDNGVDYWNVKNSWGASWGENGYIRMIRGQNECGLADMASIPSA